MKKIMDADLDADDVNLSIFPFFILINVLFSALFYFTFYFLVSIQHNCLMVPFAGWCVNRIPFYVLPGYIIVDSDG